MKQRVLWSLLLVVALLAIATPVALAYGTVTGQVNDAYGAGWTHGGTVTCTRNDDQTAIGSCTINATGGWSVALSVQNKDATCRVVPTGPTRNLEDWTCAVPGSHGSQTLSCEANNWPVGPNAVTLASFSGSRAAPAWLLAPVGLAAAVLFAWTRAR